MYYAKISIIYPGTTTMFFSKGAHSLKISKESPPLIMPGVANSTQGPGAFICDRSNAVTADIQKVTQYSL